jgi:hypothetical protein
MSELPLGPADTIERRPLSMLVPYARNARTHSNEQVAQIAASIREWGFTVPVLIDETNMIIAGHGRVLAAAMLGLQDVPVVVARNWSEAKKRAYAIADNKLTENGGWNRDLLRLEVADLETLGFNIPLIGFSEVELKALMHSNPELTDPDNAPEPPAVPVTEPGDVWRLGRHRLVCGDATNREDVSLALDGVAPNLMVTDPPYGVHYDPTWRDGHDLGVGGRSRGKVQNDDRADWREAWMLFTGNIAYVWHGGLHSGKVMESLEAAGFAMRAQIIWVKQHFVISRGDYHWQHEPCAYAVRGRGDWRGDRTQTTVWTITNNNAFGGALSRQTEQGDSGTDVTSTYRCG